MSHVMVWRGELPEDGLAGFWHHGILCPDGTIIHYSGMDGVKTLSNAQIKRTDMRQFLGNQERRVHYIRYAQSRVRFTADEIVERAASRIGERGYHLIWANCENFARWCVMGDSKSFQVQGAFIGFAGAAVSLLFGGGLLGAALTAVAAQRAWDSGTNLSDTRVQLSNRRDKTTCDEALHSSSISSPIERLN